MRDVVRVVAIIGFSCLLVACPSTQVKPPPASPSLPTVGAPDLQGATIYTVDSAASDIQVHVFRGGTLARMGHNHVMTSKNVSGRVWLRDDVARSGFELSFRVDELIVDDPAARAAAGADFPGEIKAEDREGTRKNMLRAEVLDAAQFPTITLRSARIAGTQQNPQITVRITIKGVSQDVPVDAKVAKEDAQLTTSGAFDITQTQFGMKPFSIALGALEVQDRLHIEFKLVAKQRQG